MLQIQENISSKKIQIILIVFLSFVLIVNSFSIAQTEIQYEKTNEIIFNPERGFSKAQSSALTASLINSVKMQNISVIQRLYSIPQFFDKPLSSDFLNLVQKDFDIARENGVKLVVRFSYTNKQDGKDAALDTIKLHINQLTPLFQKNYDVIAYVEAGFIGAWGEWYYSSHNLNNTASRREVLFALLDALPVKRSVVIRTPDYKRKIFNDNQPLSIDEAFRGSKKSRTGAHNDCFLANETDYGTYVFNDVEGDKNYLNLDNRFVPQGGETCCDCGFAGGENAMRDLARMHWSVLNKDYHPDVLKRWVDEGFMDEIKRKLGYRFELINSIIDDSVKPGGSFNLNFKLTNQGFASPYNPRNLEVILRNKESKKEYRLLTDNDPRFWMSGDTVNVEIEGGVSKDIPEGSYSAFLFLADPEPKLHDIADYAIRLANTNMWEDRTGYNSLNHEVKINSSVNQNDYTGTSFFEPYKGSGSINPSSMIIDGNFEDWSLVPKLDVYPNQEEIGDALNGSSDLIDIWVNDNEDEIFISFSLADDYNQNYFYHIFFDTDSDTSTGFHSGESYLGADFMLENKGLWKYSGNDGEWKWTTLGEVSFEVGQVNTNRVEIGIPKSNMEIKNNNFSLIFNVNELDSNFPDDYAPDNYKEMAYKYYNSAITSVVANSAILPTNYSIDVFPNPFNASTTIYTNAKEQDIISMSIYNILGKRIISFNPEEVKNKIVWNARDRNNNELSSGIYFFIIKTRVDLLSKKIVLLK